MVSPHHTLNGVTVCAVVLAMEITELAASEMDISLHAMKFYTDSRVALGYICNQTRCFYMLSAI